MPPPQRRPWLTKGNSNQSMTAGEEVVAADHGSDSESDKDKQRRIAASIEHKLTHDPRFYMCEVCLRCKAQRRRRVWSAWAKGLRNSELSAPGTISSDSVALIPEEDAEFEGASSALMMCDRGTDWLGCYPAATRSHDNTVEAFKQWAGPKEKAQSFHCDNAHELVGAAWKCGWRCATATTGVPQTALQNAWSEKNEDGGRCSIVQSGLCGKWRPGGARTFCFHRNIEIVDGDSPIQPAAWKGAL